MDTVGYTHPRPELLRFIPADTGAILDVGCSSGEFGRLIRRTHPGIRLVGVEPNPVAAETARQAFDSVTCGFFPDVDGIESGGGYDVVFFNDVLEHMPAPELALRAAKPLLSAKGVIVASIPNVRHVSVVGPLLIRGQFDYRDSGILDRTHLRFFTRSTIAKMFEDEGLAITQFSGINKVLHVGDSHTPKWLDLVSKLSRQRFADLLYVQYVAVGTPE